MIRLMVPGRLEYRDLLLRVASAACKLTRPEAARGEDFDNEVVSAFGEAVYYVCSQGYRARPPGDVEVEIDVEPGRITLRMTDTGRSYDPARAPALAVGALQESGMGIHIMRSFMELSYLAGPPNVLTLSKRRGDEPPPVEPEAVPR